MKWLMLLQFLIFTPAVRAERDLAANFLCEAQIKSASPQSLIELGLTRGLIANVLELAQLADFLEGKSPQFNLNRGGLNSSETMYHQTLMAQLQTYAFKEQLAQWMRQRVLELNGEGGQRESVESEVKDIALKRPPMEFVKIHGGTYMIPPQLLLGYEVTYGDIPEAALIPVHLPYDFEVLSTLVTQDMWASVMGDVPERTGLQSNLFAGAEVETFAIKGSLRELARGYPVTNVSFASLAEFANRLSREREFEVAYENLTVFGNPQDGMAALDKADMKSHFRDVQGYRLLSSVEWAVLLLGPYRELNRIQTESQKKRLHRWGWFQGNSSKMLHPVGKKVPFLFDHTTVFDLLGLVNERVHFTNLSDPKRIEINGVPFMPGDGVLHDHMRSITHVVALGGNFMTPAMGEDPHGMGNDGRADLRQSSEPNNNFTQVTGFRLARTLIPPKRKRSK